MPLHRFERSALPATPWKNGGGVTQEIACQPAGADMDHFDWRLSIAHIAADGPFSPIAGVDRVITLLEGAGVRLHTADRSIDHRLATPLAPFAFPGEAPVQGTLLGGDCHDLNVMTRRAACRAAVTVCRGAQGLPAAPAGMLLALQGRWQAAGEVLAPGQGLWWSQESVAWDLSCMQDGGALVCVTFHPVAH